MNVAELKRIVNNLPEEYDNLDVTAYEVFGRLGFACVVKNAFISKTYVNEGYPVRDTFQLHLEMPDKAWDALKKQIVERAKEESEDD